MTPDTERMVLEALREAREAISHVSEPRQRQVVELLSRVDAALSAADREAQSGGETEQIAKLRDPLIPQGNLRPLCIQAAATIERLIPYVEAFRREEDRADDLGRRLDAANATIERLTRELAEAREAIEIAAEAGFEWPAAANREDHTDGHS
jgi:predicted RNase H-like nuclease (RuvC/YqgF family)